MWVGFKGLLDHFNSVLHFADSTEEAIATLLAGRLGDKADIILGDDCPRLIDGCYHLGDKKLLVSIFEVLDGVVEVLDSRMDVAVMVMSDVHLSSMYGLVVFARRFLDFNRVLDALKAGEALRNSKVLDGFQGVFIKGLDLPVRGVARDAPIGNSVLHSIDLSDEGEGLWQVVQPQVADILGCLVAYGKGDSPRRLVVVVEEGSELGELGVIHTRYSMHGS